MDLNPPYSCVVAEGHQVHLTPDACAQMPPGFLVFVVYLQPLPGWRYRAQLLVDAGPVAEAWGWQLPPHHDHPHMWAVEFHFAYLARPQFYGVRYFALSPAGVLHDVRCRRAP